MRIARAAGREPFHLTYCTNIHPGETWDEVLANLRTHTLAVKARVSPGAPFGLGLRLSARAAARLAEPPVLQSFRHFLSDHDLYVFTINGFPYGPFHGAAVKERVYLPDWLDDERLRYSDQLAAILAALLPQGVDGSVSTVPGCFRACVPDDPARAAATAAAIAARLRRHALALWRLREETGKTVALALEPEPRCFLETTDEAIAFFEQHLLAPAAVAAFAEEAGLGRGRAAEALQRHLGVCLDACHAAVEFEAPDEALARLRQAGVRLLKVQVSAGLMVSPADGSARAALGAFAEDVYLHQVVVRGAAAAGVGTALRRWVDLPQALEEAARAPLAVAGESHSPSDEWRIHFHVPLFRERLGPFRGTQAFLVRLLDLLGRAGPELCGHLEVETYTWDVLPVEYRGEPVTEAITRELEWTLAHLLPGVGGVAP